MKPLVCILNSKVEVSLAISKEPPPYVMEKIKKKESKRLQEIPFPPVRTWDSSWEPTDW